MKKILIISPTPVYPVTSGNRARILEMCNYLFESNHEVHFWYIKVEGGDQIRMSEYFKGNFIAFDVDQKYTKSLIKKFAEKLVVLYKKFDTNLFFRNVFYGIVHNIDVDFLFTNMLSNRILDCANKTIFNTVIVEYIFLSKALEYFPKSVLKIIDTHDKFTDRYKIFLNNNQTPSWYSVYKKDEAKALNRAHIVWAIQNQEAEFFKSISKSIIKTIPCFSNKINHIPSFNYHSVLFVGSDNLINKVSILNYIENIHEKLVLLNPNYLLIVAGSVTKYINQSSKSITLISSYEENKDIYKLSNIVINPVLYGTGLKIKSFEAILYGKLLVTTEEGSKGLEDVFNGLDNALIKINDYNSMLEKLDQLLKNQELIERHLKKLPVPKIQTQISFEE